MRICKWVYAHECIHKDLCTWVFVQGICIPHRGICMWAYIFGYIQWQIYAQGYLDTSGITNKPYVPL